MGLDITVLIVDWPRIEQTPPEGREDLLMDAAFPDDEPSGTWDGPEDPERGWVWPEQTDRPWFARYVFYRTLGSYKAHFWTSQAWERIREYAEPGLRAALDGLMSGLFWYGSDLDHDCLDDQVQEGLFPDRDGRGPNILLAQPPAAVPPLVASWVAAGPRLEELRAPFDAHAARPPNNWIATFEEFADLLRDWGEVISGADRRGWGLIGLPM